MTNQYIELDPAKLVISVRYQARKTPGQMAIAELAESIAAQGLLQNLVVTKSKKRGVYEVVAGGRRLQAIQLLLRDGRWPTGQTVQVKLVQANDALAASITENTQREAMHPADEFEAFAALVAQGKSVEDIAARFGVTPQVVKRRLRLAAVAPELVQAYRDGNIKLNALMAFTVSEDHDRQRQVWEGLTDWQRDIPHVIRKSLTDNDLTARSAVTRYVGLEAYHDAGGRSYCDLFADAEDADGTYIQDRELVEKLALEKLQTDAEAIHAEGWAWVEVRLSRQSDEWRNHGRVYPEDRALTEAESEAIQALVNQRDAISAQMDTMVEEEDAWLALDSQFDDLQEQIEQQQHAAKQWPAEMLSIAGAVVSVGDVGHLHIVRGLIRPEDRRDAVTASTSSDDGMPAARLSLPQPATRPVHSERLTRQLTANKVGIVAAALSAKPDVALAVMVAQLARKVLTEGYFSCGDYGVGIGLKHEAIDQHAPDFAQSKAGREMARVRQHWIDVLPKDEAGDLSAGILDWTLVQDTQTLLDLLAYLVATSVQGVMHHEPTVTTELDRLGAVIDIDFAQWWEPTNDSYLSLVSKDRIIEVVTEGAGATAAAVLPKMKKVEAVQAAEAALAGKGWLPKVLQMSVIDSCE